MDFSVSLVVGNVTSAPDESHTVQKVRRNRLLDSAHLGN
jgi:hypothetical protein